MSTTGTSHVKAKDTEVWVLTIFFSRYKYDEQDIDSRCFTSKKLAQKAMKREARDLYKSSAIIQEADDKYFEEYPMEIHFGENPEEISYRREFGFCKIESCKLEEEESN
ncbi:hypothetical protein RclHR1_00240011 [Rhizophagus clarus]|uniref:Uncharacterized protein n=1 Tax=Rhizophagus clarus TaxID=94130 RepID=A0A2Z6QWH9_9GLOM|nr:hypothetical protein RclHR1_00240011 [Rhizophagus clarus]GES86088.1 hypothetical protein GLOIN_2v1485100 [Rhizophagus clarus]